jgi:hypothetical protein
MDNRQVLAAILVARAKPLPEPEQGEVALLRRLLLRRRLPPLESSSSQPLESGNGKLGA